MDRLRRHLGCMGAQLGRQAAGARTERHAGGPPAIELYDRVRRQYGSDRAFPEVYEKIQSELEVVARVADTGAPGDRDTTLRSE